jgi:hypothetical protein
MALSQNCFCEMPVVVRGLGAKLREESPVDLNVANRTTRQTW